MTRKDFELIAQAVKTLSEVGVDSDSLAIVAFTLSGVLTATNPRFDRKRFLLACGVKP